MMEEMAGKKEKKMIFMYHDNLGMKDYDTLYIRAQGDSIRSQKLHSKGTAYDIPTYQTFVSKYGDIC